MKKSTFYSDIDCNLYLECDHKKDFDDIFMSKIKWNLHQNKKKKIINEIQTEEITLSREALLFGDWTNEKI